MKSTIKTTHVTLTPDLSEYLAKRLASIEKLVERYGDAALLDVEIGKSTLHHQSGDVFRAELNMYLNQKSFRTVAEEQDLRAAIDVAKDEMVREITSFKDKRQGLIRRGAATIKNMLKGLGGNA